MTVKEDATMDIFSAANKQLKVPSEQKVPNIEPLRPVETKAHINSLRDNKQNEEEIKETLTKRIVSLNQQMDILNTNVKFGFNDKINAMYVNVMEKHTGKTIRKIPTEEAMSLAEKMKEIVGIIFDKKG